MLILYLLNPYLIVTFLNFLCGYFIEILNLNRLNKNLIFLKLSLKFHQQKSFFKKDRSNFKKCQSVDNLVLSRLSMGVL